MSKTGLVLIGAAVAILGYAVMYSGLTTMNPKLSPTGQAVSIAQGLLPNALSKAPAPGTQPPSGGGGGQPRVQGTPHGHGKVITV